MAHKQRKHHRKLSKTNYTTPLEETTPPIMISKIFLIMKYQNKNISILLFPLKSQHATGNEWNSFTQKQSRCLKLVLKYRGESDILYIMQSCTVMFIWPEALQISWNVIKDSVGNRNIWVFFYCLDCVKTGFNLSL